MLAPCWYSFGTIFMFLRKRVCYDSGNCFLLILIKNISQKYQVPRHLLTTFSRFVFNLSSDIDSFALWFILASFRFYFGPFGTVLAQCWSLLAPFRLHAPASPVLTSVSHWIAFRSRLSINVFDSIFLWSGQYKSVSHMWSSILCSQNGLKMIPKWS